MMANKKNDVKEVPAKSLVVAPVVAAVVPERPKRIVIDKDQYVNVMNITQGGLTYKDRHGIEYRWENEFDVIGIPFGELQVILSSKSAFLKEPWMFILEDDAIDALNLRNLYNTLIDPNDLQKFFELGEQKIEEKLMKAPKAIQEMVVRNARKQVDELTVGRQRMIERATGAQLVVE